MPSPNRCIVEHECIFEKGCISLLLSRDASLCVEQDTPPSDLPFPVIADRDASSIWWRDYLSRNISL